MKYPWLTLVLILLSQAAYAQKTSNFQVEITSSLASGWWIYTLGDGYGIDRTDNEAKLSFDAKVLYKPNRFGVGLGVGYSLLFDNSMEAFEDTRAMRSKYSIAEDYVKFLSYYGISEYAIFSGEKAIISPQLMVGGFDLETIHPEKDNFDNQWILEFAVNNEIVTSTRWSINLRPFYQVLGISVKQETLPGEKHRIYSFGLGAGIRYRW